MCAKKKLLPLPRLLVKARKVFNDWIRDRDQHKGCISCVSTVTQAGHYYSRGHYSSLMFNETNVNGQCTRCNRFLHGNLINYRKGLIAKYGEQKVQRLEQLAEISKSKKYSRLELDWIIANYSKVKA